MSSQVTRSKCSVGKHEPIAPHVNFYLKNQTDLIAEPVFWARNLRNKR